MPADTSSASLDEIDRGVLRRFDVTRKLGKGAYGIVWQATDRKSKQKVALKKSFDAFQNSTDAQRTYREVQICRMLHPHENIIGLLLVLKADNDRDLYMIFDYMDTDLHAAIRAEILEEVHKQYIVWQLFRALKYMHSAGLVHRDIKPANLLLDGDCLMKVCDFGLARTVGTIRERVMGHHHHHGHDVDSEAVMTDYIATRWFRPPEILCGSQSYDFSTDMWAAGCVLAEMYKGKTCFSGTNTLGQLDQIFLLLGWPSEKAIANLRSPFTRSMLEACGGEPSPEKQAAAWAELASIISNELAVDLLKRLLVVDPCARLSASSALEHEYVAPFHDPPKETSASFIAELKIDDNVKKTTANYREELYATLLPQEKDKAYRDRSTPGKNAPDYRRTSVVAA